MLRAHSRRQVHGVVLALALLAVGAAAHIEHHLLDPDCDGSARGASHPCACSASHAGAVAAPVVTAVPASLPRPFERASLALIAPETAEKGVCCTRGPPLA